MNTLIVLIRRNVKLFFKDKGMVFTSLITPAILLVLYATFLSNVYRDSFTANLPAAFMPNGSLIDGLVGGQLTSSLLSVSCVTVAFCSNFLMVQDKANGTFRDFCISPVRIQRLSLSYYVATLFSTLLICLVAWLLCLGYLALVGWYLTLVQVLLLLLDVVLLVLFGTALSSVISFFLSSQGQISAVGTVISAGYGFICGAYMPISSFGEGLQKVLAFFPGTYATSLFRNHAVQGVLDAMQRDGLPTEAVKQLKDTLDCNVYFFDSPVSVCAMYLILGGATALLIAVYVLINLSRKRTK